MFCFVRFTMSFFCLVSLDYLHGLCILHCVIDVDVADINVDHGCSALHVSFLKCLLLILFSFVFKMHVLIYSSFPRCACMCDMYTVRIIG